MVAGRTGHRPATRPQGEERLAKCPPDAGRRDTRAAPPAARTGAILARLQRDGPMTPKAFHALFVGSGLAPRCRFRSIRTCCDMAAAMPWRTRATTRGHYRPTSSTPCATPSWLLIGLRTSGAENVSSRCRLEPAPYGLNRNASDHVRASSMIAVMPSLSGSWKRWWFVEKVPRRSGGFKAMHGDGG